ncbi:MAG TPA: PD-(D/E)XK nuclease family protein, partial [Phycisphaerae bacterium]|nr:PD-(D/E)XK nuclease family protein [Phycisphaerae bacterium]
SVQKEMDRAFALARVMADIAVPRFFASKLLDGWETLAVEKVFQARMKPVPQPIRCRIDLAMIRKDDRIMLIDYKTCTGSTQNRAAVLSYSIQPKLERLVVQAAFPDSKVAFFLHNIAAKTSLRFPAKKYPTYDDYLPAVRDWYETKSLENPNDPPFLQSLVSLEYAPTLDDEFFRGLLNMGRACRCMATLEMFPRNSYACFGRYGNRACPYLTLCRAGLDQYPELLAKLYVCHFREDDEDRDQEEGD